MRRGMTLLVVMGMLLMVWAGNSWALTVYIMGSGDPDTDGALVTALTAKGHMPIVGVEAHLWDGSQNDLSAVDTVILLNSHNWDTGDMPEAGQQALVNWVKAGGGLVVGEWAHYNAYRGSYQILAKIFPVVLKAWRHALTATYTRKVANVILDRKLPTSFPFAMDNVGGSDSKLRAKTGAKVYYSSSYGGNPGVVGWARGQGHVLSLNTLITATELASARYARLLVNAVVWVAH